MRPPVVDEKGIAPSPTDLQELFDNKYRMPYGLGWGPQLRRDFGYYQPDDYYEALVAKLITGECSWADVGCGRDIFPSNTKLAAHLAKKARYVLGIDPDDNIRENTFLTERFQGLVEECSTEKTFDVVTLRMVAEHIQDPQRVAQKLAVLTKTNGVVVVFTPNKWAPMSVIAKAIPFALHHPLKQLIWSSEEKDTFPVAYKLNSLRELSHHFERHRFQLIFFTYLDDCTVSGRYRIVNRLELRIRNLFFRAGLPYPENCLLAVFKKD
jgi:SAM-dependent methyltransferase